MTDLELHQNPSTDLATQMEYAHAVQSAALLPQAYRGKPADIMLAVGLGQSMGLSPAESLYRIDVIQGKPTASAELIAANVRKAGHRLRVETDEAAMSVTCTIWRADDPEFPHRVTRDMGWAKGMGLAAKENYRKQPLTMLEWRATSACARKACSEALYGVAYTPDEMADIPAATRAGGLAAAMGATVTAEQITPEPEPEPDPEPQMSDHTRRHMFALLNEAGITNREKQLAGINTITGGAYESRGDLTEAHALAVIDSLQGRDQGGAA